MIEELEHRIRERAYNIWEREGRPADRADAHWSIAFAEFTATKKPAARAKTPRKVAAAKAEPAPKLAAAAPRRTAKAKAD